MNQGNIGKYGPEDSVFRNSGFTNFQRSNAWFGFFISIASQAVYRRDRAYDLQHNMERRFPA
ncbi:hypothetical protein BJX63DRAFT_414746 [Aspergillus granulosus]|uniref:Uncharacterized protein n=1 Tax=Aspergillus granulosus TaxID=176169 RepID=A0ABR4GUA7_9EURO